MGVVLVTKRIMKGTKNRNIIIHMYVKCDKMVCFPKLLLLTIDSYVATYTAMCVCMQLHTYVATYVPSFNAIIIHIPAELLL